MTGSVIILRSRASICTTIRRMVLRSNRIVLGGVFGTGGVRRRRLSAILRIRPRMEMKLRLRLVLGQMVRAWESLSWKKSRMRTMDGATVGLRTVFGEDPR